MTTFVSNAQFLVLYDGRWVGKNVLDDGTASTVASLQDPTSPGGLVLAALILEASEMLMAAAAVGARYSITDIATYGGSLLIRIVSDLTMGLILKRRARALSDEAALSGPYAEALQYLEQLRRGERIFFAVPDVPEAGLPGSTPMEPFNLNGVPITNPAPGVVGIGPCNWVNSARRYFGYGAGGCNGGNNGGFC